MNALIRPATTADAAGIAEVHVGTWQAAYAGQLPAEYLDSLSVERARRTMENRLAAPDPTGAVLVADSDGKIAGFVNCGRAREQDAPEGRGEVYAIYVAASHWRHGIGRLLHDAALKALRAKGFSTATLWVLHSNTAVRDFYTTVGWIADGAERTEEFGGTTVTEVRYAHPMT